MKKLSLNIDGKELEVIAQKVAGQVWFHFEGTTYQYIPKSDPSHSSSGASQDPSKIVSPMPGKIIKVFVEVGDSVKEGETLVAMEAMKMEYNLKAEQPMKVRSIRCQAGDQVGLGDLLVDLEEENA